MNSGYKAIGGYSEALISPNSSAHWEGHGPVSEPGGGTRHIPMETGTWAISSAGARARAHFCVSSRWKPQLLQQDQAAF